MRNNPCKTELKVARSLVENRIGRLVGLVGGYLDPEFPVRGVDQHHGLRGHGCRQSREGRRFHRPPEVRLSR